MLVETENGGQGLSVSIKSSKTTSFYFLKRIVICCQQDKNTVRLNNHLPTRVPRTGIISGVE